MLPLSAPVWGECFEEEPAASRVANEDEDASDEDEAGGIDTYVFAWPTTTDAATSGVDSWLPEPGVVIPSPSSTLRSEAPSPIFESRRYYVSKFLKQRTYKGVPQLLTKWIGYKEPTWEPRRIMEADVPQIVEDFDRGAAPKAGRRKTRR